MHWMHQYGCWLEVTAHLHKNEPRTIATPPVQIELRYIRYYYDHPNPKATAEFTEFVTKQIPAVLRFKRQELIPTFHLRRMTKDEAKHFPDNPPPH